MFSWRRVDTAGGCRLDKQLTLVSLHRAAVCIVFLPLLLVGALTGLMLPVADALAGSLGAAVEHDVLVLYFCVASKPELMCYVGRGNHKRQR